VPTLRWTRCSHRGQGDAFEAVTLREVIACLQDYEPARRITSDVLAAHRHDRGFSTHRLRGELQRLDVSETVLNRGVREAVRRKVTRGEMSLSQIAMRCGRMTRDPRGNHRGETSWLARRIGQLPEAGGLAPTPWGQSAVLALIAREGLGVSPNEVEL
jgi:hypothetical protein